MFAFYQSLIDEHRDTLDINNARDLIDVYLIEIERAKTEGKAGELFEGRDHGNNRKELLKPEILDTASVCEINGTNNSFFYSQNYKSNRSSEIYSQPAWKPLNLLYSG